MPIYTAQQTEPFLDFESGIDRENARTFLDRTLYGAYSLYHAYEDAQNIVLQSATSGKHPTSVKPDSQLDSLIAWPAGNVIWIGSFTFPAFANNVLSFSTHLLTARDDGSVWRYDYGAPGTLTLIRRGFSTATKYWSDQAYNQWLCTFNGVDAPMKYGQHLNYDNQNEPRPFLIPLGAKLITPFVANAYKVAGEVWSGNFSFISDALVLGGGSRQGPETLQVPASGTATLTYTASTNGSGSTFTSRDFLNPPQPFTATPQFSGSDFLVFQYFKPAGTSTFNVTFSTSPGNGFSFTITPTTGSWQTARLLRSSATVVGTTGNWNSINYIQIINNDVTYVLYIDDMYMLYANAPPALKFATVHKDRLVGAGVPTTAVTLLSLYWSNAVMPDYYPAANTQQMTTSQNTLGKTGQVTALREYGDSVVVGVTRGVLSWTIGTDGNPVKSTVTTQFGIDAHRAVMETPVGSLIFPWSRAFYTLRATGRQYASAKVAPLLATMSLDDPTWTVGVNDDTTKTLRYWFRQGTSQTSTANGIIFDYVRAQGRGEPVWPGTMSQLADFATNAYINGQLVVLYCRFNSPQIFQLGGASSGLITSYVTLPWMSRGGRDKLEKAIGLTVPISNTVPVTVQARYANHPGEFDLASFATVDTIQPTAVSIPGAGQQVVTARVPFGKTTRWFQVKFLATSYGFELFPPVETVALETQRTP